VLEIVSKKDVNLPVNQLGHRKQVLIFSSSQHMRVNGLREGYALPCGAAID